MNFVCELVDGRSSGKDGGARGYKIRGSCHVHFDYSLELEH